VRVTVSVDCDSLGISLEEKLRAGCDLVASLARGVRESAGEAPLLPDHRAVPAGVHASAPVGAITLCARSSVLFVGEVDGVRTRVRRLSRRDLVAEVLRPALPEGEDAAWEACGDLHAMRAFEAAILSAVGDLPPPQS
jgi:hypothetical protein